MSLRLRYVFFIIFASCAGGGGSGQAPQVSYASLNPLLPQNHIVVQDVSEESSSAPLAETSLIVTTNNEQALMDKLGMVYFQEVLSKAPELLAQIDSQVSYLVVLQATVNPLNYISYLKSQGFQVEFDRSYDPAVSSATTSG